MCEKVAGKNEGLIKFSDDGGFHSTKIVLLLPQYTYRVYSCINRISGRRFQGKIFGVDLYKNNVYGHVAAEWYRM